MPFGGANKKIIMSKIRNGKFEWPTNVNLSDECKDFISCLLCINTEKRLNAEDALEHEWIIKYLEKPSKCHFNYNSLNNFDLDMFLSKLHQNEIHSYETDIYDDQDIEIVLNEIEKENEDNNNNKNTL